MRFSLRRKRIWWAGSITIVLLGTGLVGAVGLGITRTNEHRRGSHHRHAPVDYTTEVKPILTAHCARCHGPTRQKAGLRFDTAAGIRQASMSGDVILPGYSANSLLIATVTGVEGEPRMPPTGEPLNAAEIETLRAWIDQGATTPEEPAPPPDPLTQHWAFRPPTRPAVPSLHNAGLIHNPIDAFLAAGLEMKGLAPSPPTPRGLLLRRVFLDLVGLPPTKEELQAFLKDDSDGAYEQTVERLLASPQYGERWGRHWMDVWRYSDPDGRKAKKDIWWSDDHIWRWRDWIITSLNADMGYDQMVVAMLAGDELAPGDPQMLAATGFLVRNWFKLNRNVWLNNTVEHTSKALLGLTINCARCHDHKFDPISQVEYYRFRAFFEPHDVRTEPLDGGTDPQAAVAHAYDARPNEPTWVFLRGDERMPDKSTTITPGTPAALGGQPVAPRPIAVPWTKGSVSTGRRLALARWITDRQNPLTARVAVNHVWARHFGRPLVDNVTDFGMRTEAPDKQPLLDWLAVEFMDHGWSMKWLHRIMVTSATYQMQSSELGASAANIAADPDNGSYWRMNSQRMQAEVVRDALLLLSGDLDPTMGGPPLNCLDGPSYPRRSVYHRYSREDRMQFLTAFDAAGVEECYRRQESIVPQQALALENADFVWDRARLIAHRLGANTRSPREFVVAAFEILLGRLPSDAERVACERFLTDQERLLADPTRLTVLPPLPPPPKLDPELMRVRVPGLPLTLTSACPLPRVDPASDPAQRACEDLIHALLNHNDFITIR